MVWQDHWRRIVALPTLRYDFLGGTVGKDFITMRSSLWEGIMDDKHNAKKPTVLMVFILQKCNTDKKVKDVLCRVAQCLEMWHQGHFAALV